MFCGKSKTDDDNILLLADSRAYDMYIALRIAYPDYTIRTAYAIGCPPLLDPGWSTTRFSDDCRQLNRMRLQAALDAPPGEIVFLAMDLSDWRGPATVETVQRLVESGKRVYVLGQTEFLEGKTPRDIAVDQRRWSWGDSYVDRFLTSHPFFLDTRYGPEIAKAGATYISNREFFHRDHYRLFTEDGSDLLSYDGKHLSRAGAEEFGRYLAQRYPLE